MYTELILLQLLRTHCYIWFFLLFSPNSFAHTFKPSLMRANRQLKQTTIAVHVRYNSLYISLPFSAKQQHEMTKFCIFWGTSATTANILDFLMELITGITYLVWAGFREIRAMNGFSNLWNSGVKFKSIFFAGHRPWRRHRLSIMTYKAPNSSAIHTYIVQPDPCTFWKAPDSIEEILLAPKFLNNKMEHYIKSQICTMWGWQQHRTIAW